MRPAFRCSRDSYGDIPLRIGEDGANGLGALLRKRRPNRSRLFSGISHQQGDPCWEDFSNSSMGLKRTPELAERYGCRSEEKSLPLVQEAVGFLHWR
jgi:hypothetical protein